MEVTVTCEENSQFGVSFVLSDAPKVDSTNLRFQYQFDGDAPISVKTKRSNLNPRHGIVELDKDELAAFLERLATSDAIEFTIGSVEDRLDLKEMKTAVDEYRNMLANADIVDLESNTESNSDIKRKNLPGDETEVESSTDNND